MKTIKIKIDIKDVVSVYGGKNGCMCGCKGKYKYNSQHRVVAGTDRGYAVADKDISDRAIKMAVNKFNKFDSVLIDSNNKGGYCDHIFVQSDTRINVIYLLKGTVDRLLASQD